MDCSVEWDEIDETTFISFWEFVYTRDYGNPESHLTTLSNVIARNHYDHADADEFDAEAAKNAPVEEPEPEPAPAPAPAPEPAPEREPAPEPSFSPPCPFCKTRLLIELV